MSISFWSNISISISSTIHSILNCIKIIHQLMISLDFSWTFTTSRDWESILSPLLIFSKLSQGCLSSMHNDSITFAACVWGIWVNISNYSFCSVTNYYSRCYICQINWFIFRISSCIADYCLLSNILLYVLIFLKDILV